MAEVYRVTDSVLEGEKPVAGKTFNLYKLTLEAENGIQVEDVECWRQVGSDPVLAGEDVVADVLTLPKGRKKIQIDWEATNAHRQDGGSGDPSPAPSSGSGVQSGGNTREDRIEFQSARRDAVAYAALYTQATGEVPPVEDILKWAGQFQKGAS